LAPDPKLHAGRSTFSKVLSVPPCLHAINPRKHSGRHHQSDTVGSLVWRPQRSCTMLFLIPFTQFPNTFSSAFLYTSRTVTRFEVFM